MILILLMHSLQCLINSNILRLSKTWRLFSAQNRSKLIHFSSKIFQPFLLRRTNRLRRNIIIQNLFDSSGKLTSSHLLNISSRVGIPIVPIICICRTIQFIQAVTRKSTEKYSRINTLTIRHLCWASMLNRIKGRDAQKGGCTMHEKTGGGPCTPRPPNTKLSQVRQRSRTLHNGQALSGVYF